ncbi:histone-lysine N-methyltransferase SETD2 isoform X2 [Bacillus rossius redtenbacheri]|uniref:histone-lysine N-methyltransferase SETD2 isoform X2 n=1 Tax=Bacillus rossius redtenbacheri TaxID=93214 RepID=UPI002FDDA2B9
MARRRKAAAAKAAGKKAPKPPRKGRDSGKMNGLVLRSRVLRGAGESSSKQLVLRNTTIEVFPELVHKRCAVEPAEERVSWGEGEEVVEETVVCEEMEVGSVIEYLEEEQVVVMREEEIEVIRIEDVESQVVVGGDVSGVADHRDASGDVNVKSVMQVSCDDVVKVSASKNSCSNNNLREACRDHFQVTCQDSCYDRPATGSIIFPNSFCDKVHVAATRNFEADSISGGEKIIEVKTFPEVIHVSQIGLDRLECISSTMRSVSDDASNDSVIVRGVELEIESEPACDSQDVLMNRLQDCEMKEQDTSNTCSDDVGPRDDAPQFSSNMERSEMARVLGIEYDSLGGTVTVGSDIVQLYEEPVGERKISEHKDRGECLENPIPVTSIEHVVNNVCKLKIEENCTQSTNVGCYEIENKDDVPFTNCNENSLQSEVEDVCGKDETNESETVIKLNLAVNGYDENREKHDDETDMSGETMTGKQLIKETDCEEEEMGNQTVEEKFEKIFDEGIDEKNFDDVGKAHVSVREIEEVVYEPKDGVCQEITIKCNVDETEDSDNQCITSCVNKKTNELMQAEDRDELKVGEIVVDKSKPAAVKGDDELEARGDQCHEEGELADRKQQAPAFRSRSGSTDTTSSESSSSCSNGVRRSSRIRSIEVSKQRCPKGEVSGSGLPDGGKASPRESVPVPASLPPAAPGPDPDCLKPVKVKSRWRRSSELEMGGSSRSSDSPPTPSLSPRQGPPAAPPTPLPSPAAPPSPDPSTDTEEKLRQFVPLVENMYLTDRHTSKEAKRMICDCFLSQEEMVRGEMGCGEDCLNSLLMIECGSRCPVGDRCANKRFQKQQYTKCEVFKTEKKGFGLRALQNVPSGTFIMEYVGEVLDPKEFRRRAKEYSKDKNRHYYFMALKSDAIIDATMRGNISRFINHSCDPNAETQKWTVNGELRIGFFSTRPVAAREEVTFDYQLQRYGKEAQRCYCEAAVCRGWIGGDPEKEKQVRKERKEKKKKEEKRKEVREFLDDMDLEEEIEKLCASGLKNRNHTLTLSRLMVRAEDCVSRKQLLKLLQTGEPACRRLFIDYHGLRLIWSWMMSVGQGNQDNGISLKMEILKTLLNLPVPNKTVLQESKVLSVVEKWAVKLCGPSDNHPNAAHLGPIGKHRSSVEEDSGDGSIVSYSKPRFDQVLPTDVELPDEDTAQDIENEKQLVDSVTKEKRPNNLPVKTLDADLDDEVGAESALVKSDQPEDLDKEEHVKASDEGNCDSGEHSSCLELASSLLAEWASLKEVFRIPKKERLEQMKEHEREADRGYKEYLDREEVHNQKTYDRHRKRGEYERPRDRSKRSKDSPDSERSRKISRYEDRVIVPLPRISKEEHRQLFAMKVARREEEERQRRQQQEMWQQHEQRCMALGMDPRVTSAFDPGTGYPCFYDPGTNMWQPYPPSQDPNSLTPPEIRPSPIYKPGNPHMPAPPLLQPAYDPNSPHYPHGHSLPYDGGSHGAYVEVRPALPPAEPLLPEFIPLPTGPQPRPHLLPLPRQQLVPARLPPKWKSAKDSEGRVYYYHVRERVSQWEPPPWPDAIRQVETDSSSETSEDDEDEDDDDEEDEDEEQSSSDEEEEEEENEQEDKVGGDEEEIEDEEMEDLCEERLEEETNVCAPTEESPQLPLPEQTEKVVEQTDEKSREKKREGLVQERIISKEMPRSLEPGPGDVCPPTLPSDALKQPRREEDKADAINFREIKEKLRRKKEREQSRSREHDKRRHHRSGRQRSSRSGSEKTLSMAADTSSDSARKIKDQFRLQMASVIVQYLNPYRKPDCARGRITNTEDFKHLARKLTHFVMVKELKHCHSVEDLECNENVKHKARDFVKKYMTKYGATYERPKNDN